MSVTSRRPTRVAENLALVRRFWDDLYAHEFDKVGAYFTAGAVYPMGGNIDVLPGQVEEIQVELPASPGTYEFWSGQPGDRAGGMVGHFVVAAG